MHELLHLRLPNHSRLFKALDDKLRAELASSLRGSTRNYVDC